MEDVSLGQEPLSQDSGATESPIPKYVRRRQLAKRLEALFPMSLGAQKALKIGIFEDLQAWVASNPESGFSKRSLKEALNTHCNRPRYLGVLSKGGARVDLDGTPSGDITEDQVVLAKKQLSCLQKKQAEKRKALKKAHEAPQAPQAPKPTKKTPESENGVPWRPILRLKAKKAKVPEPL